VVCSWGVSAGVYGHLSLSHLLALVYQVVWQTEGLQQKVDIMVTIIFTETCIQVGRQVGEGELFYFLKG
jgi:hypothetical protein